MTENLMNKSNDKQETVDDGAFKLWLPAGLTLTGIGALTLLTPFFTQLDARGFTIDMISGGVLMIAGSVAMVKSRAQSH